MTSSADARINLTGLAATVTLVLAGLLVPASPAQASSLLSTSVGAEEGAGITNITHAAIYPNPGDRRQPRATEVTYGIDTNGRYQIWVTRGSSLVTDEILGDVEGSTGHRSWTWDGRNHQGDLVRPGNYKIALMKRIGRNYFDGVGRSARVEVRDSTDRLTVRDRTMEPSSGRVDLTGFGLDNGARQVAVRFDFRRAMRRHLFYAYAQLEVDRASRGYLLSVRRRPQGGFTTSLELTYLASDAGRPKKVVCPGMSRTIATSKIDVMIPRACLRAGGDKMRANYGAIGTNRRDYDGGPDTTDYWTRWTQFTTYE